MSGDMLSCGRENGKIGANVDRWPLGTRVVKGSVAAHASVE